MTKNAIIVGMPRSGTSLISSIFSRRGFFVADDEAKNLRDGDSFNPSGYFESEGLIDANTNVLARAGFEHHNTWMFDGISDGQAAAIDNLERLENDRQFLAEFDDRLPWMWKDPRLCYTLSYWWPMIDASNTRVVLVRRNPDQIWKSFLRLGWRDESEENRQEVNGRIEHHLSAAENAIDKYDIPFIEIDYDEFSTNIESVVEKINRGFNLNLEVVDLGFDPKLNHSGFRGSIEIWLEKILEKIPSNWKARAKSVVPMPIQRALFPSRRIR